MARKKKIENEKPVYYKVKKIYKNGSVTIITGYKDNKNNGSDTVR